MHLRPATNATGIAGPGPAPGIAIARALDELQSQGDVPPAMAPRTLAWAALGGAMLFDGTALAFVPGLYGQTGDAWTYAGTMLLWAFGWQVVTELLVERRRG